MNCHYSCVDLSHNQLEDTEIVEVFGSMPSLVRNFNVTTHNRYSCSANVILVFVISFLACALPHGKFCSW